MALSQAGRFTYENDLAEAAAAAVAAVPAEDEAAVEPEAEPEPEAAEPAAEPARPVPLRASPANPAAEQG